MFSSGYADPRYCFHERVEGSSHNPKDGYCANCGEYLKGFFSPEEASKRLASAFRVKLYELTGLKNLSAIIKLVRD